MDNILDKKLKDIGIELDNRQLEQFNKYYELLIEWNKVMNLTGITEYEEVVEKHFVDSLVLVKVCDMKDIHTAKEKLSIPSVERMWEYLLKVLEAL